MSIKDIKEGYPAIYEKSDKKALAWILKNKKALTAEFKASYPKSPFKFVAQFATTCGTMTINDEGDIKRAGNVAYLTIDILERLGCPISL